MIEQEKIMLVNVTNARNSIQLPESLTIELFLKYLRAKHFWGALERMFDNYFKGKELFHTFYWCEKTLDFKYFLELYFFRYLKMYTIINSGWSDIQPFMSILRNPIHTPGDLIKYILSCDAKMWVSEKNQVKPETFYRMWRLNAIHKTDENVPVELQKLLTRSLRQIKVVSLDEYQKPHHLYLLDVCLEKIGKKTNSLIAKTTITEYHDLNAKIETWLSDRLYNIVPKKSSKVKVS